MVSALDEAVGNVTRTLKETGLYNNTIIFFTADVLHDIGLHTKVQFIVSF